MSNEESPVTCANPDCRVNETRKCVEGIETDKCPHFGRPPHIEETSESDDDEVRLHAGLTLSTEGATRLLRSGDAKVVAVIGPSDSGKTSLIASLYDLFQSGPVSNYDFSGSLSLHEFEHICHDARAASRRGVPHISRTPLGEVRFYHVEIGRDNGVRALNILIADRAGEHYRSATNDISNVREYVEVARADVITILVDGARLLDNTGRHNLRAETLLMCQAIIESQVLVSRPPLAVVLTKRDLVLDSPAQARAETDFASLVQAISARFGAAFARIESFQTAASPMSDQVARGEGIADLMNYWIASEPIPPADQPAVSSASRVFGTLRSNDSGLTT